MKNNVSTLQLTILIMQTLKRYECTYKEMEEILNMLSKEYSSRKEDLEYQTLENYYACRKVYNADDDIVSSIDFHPIYFPEIR